MLEGVVSSILLWSATRSEGLNAALEIIKINEVLHVFLLHLQLQSFLHATYRSKRWNTAV
jgi:hypothetical protein